MSTYMKAQGKGGENTELQEKLTSNEEHIKQDAVKKSIRDKTSCEDMCSLLSAVVNMMPKNT